MTVEELDDIYTALWMRRNFIETGNPALSANDAIASKQHKIIRDLEPTQKKTIARIEGLMEKFLAAKQRFESGEYRLRDGSGATG